MAVTPLHVLVLLFAAGYVIALAYRHNRRQKRAHEKFTVLANLLEHTYGIHAEEVAEAGEAGSGTPRGDGERGLGKRLGP